MLQQMLNCLNRPFKKCQILVLKINQFFHLFRLDSLLQNSYKGKNIKFFDNKQKRSNPFRSLFPNDPLVTVLPNRRICFGGRILTSKMPLTPIAASEFQDIINAFAKYIKHIRYTQLLKPMNVLMVVDQK